MAIRPAAIAVAAPESARPRTWSVLVRFIRRKPLGAAGGVLMVVMVLTAVLAEFLQTHDPIATDAAYTLGRPSAEHWLGTDHLGRDRKSVVEGKGGGTGGGGSWREDSSRALAEAVE